MIDPDPTAISGLPSNPLTCTSSLKCRKLRSLSLNGVIKALAAESVTVLAVERTQIRSDPIPGLSVDTMGAFRVEIPVARSELDSVRAG